MEVSSWFTANYLGFLIITGAFLFDFIGSDLYFCIIVDRFYC